MTDNLRARRRLERLAWLLDDSIRVPVIDRRIGLDSIIGLVPVVGDAIGGALSISILIGAARMGVGWPTLLRMLGNVVIEVAVGAIPLAGDLFDMGFKANRRNVNLMQQYLDRPREIRRASRLRVVGISTAIVTVAVVSTTAALWLLYNMGVAIFGSAG